MISDDLRRVLLEGPSGPDDHETARYLIEQGLADGRYGPPSKSRDHYGKTTQLVWFGITPAGRLWLEQSARAELDKAEFLDEHKAKDDTEKQAQEALNAIAKAITGLPKPPSNLVGIALGVIVMALGAMVLHLIGQHLGISLL